MINHHLNSLAVALQAVDAQAPRLQRWGSTAASALLAGGRLLACGTGGSQTQVQHLVGTLARPENDRPALAVLALPAPSAPGSQSTGSDQGGPDLRRQVRKLGRPGDILLCVCATGDSDDLADSARAATEVGMTTWALTGPGPNQVAGACADALAVSASAVSTAEEVHLAAIHIFCAAVNSAVRDSVRAQTAAAWPPVAVPSNRRARLRPRTAS
jgi:D-sedoheptulose 7-phosphate isomerase